MSWRTLGLLATLARDVLRLSDALDSEPRLHSEEEAATCRKLSWLRDLRVTLSNKLS